MPLAYTQSQFVREAQLLVTELNLLNDLVIGEGAGVRALGLDRDSGFAQSLHPDDLDLDVLEGMVFFPSLQRIECYVREQRWDAGLSTDIRVLRHAIERTFSPAVLEAYASEREEMGDVDVPEPFDEGAGDTPLGYFYHGILAALVAHAEARMKVDENERLTMADLALLLDMREPTVITNAYRKNFPTVEDGNRRYAEPVDVLPWMRKHGYTPTTTSGAAAQQEPQAEGESETVDVVFVPVARDGTWFGPDCASNGRFTIGAKGAQAKYADYFEALDALQRMPTPRWRRPNRKGAPGIVSEVRFERMRRSDIERALV